MPYPDVYPWVVSKLPDALQGLTDADLSAALDMEIKSVIRQTLGPYPVTYDTLTGDDLDAVNEAVGLRTAIRVYAQYVTGGVSLSLLQDATDDSKRQYEGSEGLLAQWERQAAIALKSTAFVGSPSAGPYFGVNGRSRHRCTTDRPILSGQCEDCIRGPLYT